MTGTNAVSFGGYSGGGGYGGPGIRGPYGGRGRYGAFGARGAGGRVYQGAAGVLIGRKMLQQQQQQQQQQKLEAVGEIAAAGDTTIGSTCKTMLEIVQSRDDLSMFREILNDIPQVKATLDAKNFTSAATAGGAAAAAAANPLRDEDGSYFVDTLFAPNDDAILELERFFSSHHGHGNSTSIDGDYDGDERRADDDDAGDLVASSRRERAMKQLLGKGNATVAAAFVGYHVVPDMRVKLPELTEGELLNTALGGAYRLMAHRFKRSESDGEAVAAANRDDDEDEDGDGDGWGGDDGYDDGDGEAVIRGMGSQAGVLGGGTEACNGVVFVIDRVLLPEDLDGDLDER